LLEIKNLCAGYDHLQVLKNVNFNVGSKEIVALVGPNGAGKSTVLKSIFNIANVTGGKINFKGKDITKLPTHELLELGISYVPQGRINFNNLTIRENLELGGDLTKDKEVVKKNLDYVYQKFPVLKSKRDKLAYTLSGGEQQMLALGRALMQNPALLLLDEPTLGLSPKLQKELFKIVMRLRDEEGLSILIVEQNAKKAILASDRTYVLEDGKVALTGTKREVLHNPKMRNIYLGGR